MALSPFTEGCMLAVACLMTALVVVLVTSCDGISWERMAPGPALSGFIDCAAPFVLAILAWCVFVLWSRGD